MGTWKSRGVAVVIASLVMTIIAVVLLLVSIVIPGWIRVSTSFAGEIQIGIWKFCVDGKDCKPYGQILGSTNLPKDIKKMIRQIIVPPVLLMASVGIASMVVSLSIVLAAVALCRRKKGSVRLIMMHVGLNAASCFMIACAVSTIVTIGGDFSMINTIGGFLRFFNLSMKASYGPCMYLASSAALICLLSAILCCFLADVNSDNRKPPEHTRKESTSEFDSFKSSLYLENEKNLLNEKNRKFSKSERNSRNYKNSRDSNNNRSDKSSGHRNDHSLYTIHLNNSKLSEPRSGSNKSRSRSNAI